ncbi:MULTISPECIES: CRISPR-associated protein Cas4 [Bacillota]|uniref:CRISPR-associated protein Cas4 n=1 Tax=Bacillota TaxID=1239 RepID=UPI0039EE7934
MILRNIRGKLIYTDEPGTELLVSEVYQIDGKPDYIFKQPFGHLMPLELKRKKLIGSDPYLGDVMQMAAYFLLIEENYKKKPRYGIIEYKNKKCLIRNSFLLRKRLIRQINEMKQVKEQEYVKGFRKNKNKCTNCSHRPICKV